MKIEFKAKVAVEFEAKLAIQVKTAVQLKVKLKAEVTVKGEVQFDVEAKFDRNTRNALHATRKIYVTIVTPPFLKGAQVEVRYCSNMLAQLPLVGGHGCGFRRCKHLSSSLSRKPSILPNPSAQPTILLCLPCSSTSRQNTRSGFYRLRLWHYW